MYPGMDNLTASTLVEATARNAFAEFVDSLMVRAAELLKMPEDALKAIEADINNIRPIAMTVSTSKTASSANPQLRKVASDGNMIVAPSDALPSQEGIPSDSNRNNIRSALGTTKICRASKK
jgi:hypothetical protein